MSEESNQVTDNNAPQENAEPTPQQTTDKSPGYQPPEIHMAKEISRLKAELEQQKKAQQEAQEAARQKQLEEQGKWQEVATDAQSKLKAAQDTHAAEVRRLTLEAGFAGIQDEFTREGVIAKCPPDADPREYIAEIKDKYPELLNPISADTATRTAAQGVRSGSGAGNWAADKALIEAADANPGTVDPSKLRAAWARVQDYTDKHGKRPW